MPRRMYQEQLDSIVYDARQQGLSNEAIKIIQQKGELGREKFGAGCAGIEDVLEYLYNAIEVDKRPEDDITAPVNEALTFVLDFKPW